METAAKTFFSSRYFAVAGASQNTSKYGYKGTPPPPTTLPSLPPFGPSNPPPPPQVLAWYHTHSLPVQPITPSTPTITVSNTTYTTLASPLLLPHPTETSLSIITPPQVTKKILKEANEVGVPAVWLQPGTFDEEVLAYVRGEFVAGVAGEGGRGGEGWCVLVDGEGALGEAKSGGGRL